MIERERTRGVARSGAHRLARAAYAIEISAGSMNSGSDGVVAHAAIPRPSTPRPTAANNAGIVREPAMRRSCRRPAPPPMKRCGKPVVVTTGWLCQQADIHVDLAAHGGHFGSTARPCRQRINVTKKDATPEAAPEAAAEAAPAPPAAPAAGIPRKTWLIIGAVTIAVWAFAINTGSTWVLGIVGALTLVLIGVLLWALRTIRKHRSTVSLLQGAIASPEARKEALAKLSEGKDANTPTNVFARAQLMAQDEPQAALKLLESVELKNYHPSMQDDVSLLQTQLYLRLGRTGDARRTADVMNLDNPQRKEIRPLAASIVAEAWARGGKPKEALALLETIELPKKDAEQIALQVRVARIFARFAANQRGPARAELAALADEDPNQLGRFVLPQFRVHPELQKLARSVAESHPSMRRQIKSTTKATTKRR